MSIQKEDSGSTLEQTLRAIKVWRTLFGEYQEGDIVQINSTGELGMISSPSVGWTPKMYAVWSLDDKKFLGWFVPDQFTFIRISDKKLAELQT